MASLPAHMKFRDATPSDAVKPPTRKPPKRAAKRAADALVRAVAVSALERVSLPSCPFRSELLLHPKKNKLIIRMYTNDRDTGLAVWIDVGNYLPNVFASDEHALEWIYACLRDAWVHELNEFLFVDGVRWRDLHKPKIKGRLPQTIQPPDEAGDAAVANFKRELAAFLLEAL